MRKIILFSLLANLCIFRANAQYTVEYVYDDGGNRYKRIIIPLPSSAPGETHAETQGEPQPEAKQVADSIPPIIEQLGVLKLEVFPNPTKGRLLVRISGGKADEAYLYTLFNTAGLQIYQGNMKEQGEYPVEMEQYPNGIYILLIQAGNEKLSYKIIKE